MSLASTVLGWRPLRRGRRSALLVAFTAFAVLGADTFVLLTRAGVTVAGVAFSPTTLLVEAPGDLTTHNAYVGTTYNMGLWLNVVGPGEVQILSARARTMSGGLDQPEAVIGRGCEGRETWGGVLGANLNRKAKTEVHALREPRLREEHGNCWYLLLRFVPRRHGRLHARDGEIVYRVDGIKVRKSFDFRTAFDVKHDGRDPREKPDIR